MLFFTLANERQKRQIQHEGGPIEFGRGPERELPRVIVEDRYTSRDQLRVEELATGDVRLTNLGSSPVTAVDGAQLAAGEARTFVAPTRVTFGYTTLEIGVVPRDDNFASSLHTIRPLHRSTEHAPALGLKLKVSDEAPTPETLTQWFETLLTVQKAAAGSNEFYQETACAVVQLVGLERGMVLLREQGEWNCVARHSTLERDTGKYSRRVLEEVVRKRSTFYQSFSGSENEGSLQLVDAVVASPIFDQHDAVVGAVYGSRDLRTITTVGRRGIQPLEAQLVQVLAGAVSAGLARCAREAEATRARVQFEQFVSAELAKALERDAGILAAQERELTLLFADLRGFSRISERIGPQQTYDLLSDILDRFTNQIMDQGGVVIDYYGDGLAAMWNAPFDQPDHAARAAAAAQAMQDELPAINVAWAERLGSLIKIGVGLHTGVSQVGNSGSRRRMKYGPRGHAVNLASRVEAATKVLGIPCLLTGATRACLPAEVYTRRLCRVRLTGMASAVELFELAPERPSDVWFRQRDLYEQALALYEEDKAAECIDLVNKLVGQFGSHDVPTVRLQLRAQSRMSHASAEFDPVMSVETKS